VDRTTRHDLKSDKFVQEVAHSVEFFEKHRGRFIRYGAIVLALVIAGAGIIYFMKSRRAARIAELSTSMEVYNSTVGTDDMGGRMKVYPTEEARQAAIKKELTGLISRNAGSEEAGVASYLLGANAADQGNIAEARKYLSDAVKDGGKEYGSLAKLALAGIARSEGKMAEAETLLRELVNSPSTFVGQQQATIELAKLIAPTKPEEARKLLEPLKTENTTAGRTALTMLADLSKGK
jgi:predicted negative regulator of RcsB-dependent stress response